MDVLYMYNMNQVAFCDNRFLLKVAEIEQKVIILISF